MSRNSLAWARGYAFYGEYFKVANVTLDLHGDTQLLKSISCRCVHTLVSNINMHVHAVFLTACSFGSLSSIIFTKEIRAMLCDGISL